MPFHGGGCVLHLPGRHLRTDVKRSSFNRPFFTKYKIGVSVTGAIRRSFSLRGPAPWATVAQAGVIRVTPAENCEKSACGVSEEETDMKLVRYGRAGAERPGILDENGCVRDLSAIVPDLRGAALNRYSLEKIARLDTASLPAVSGEPRLGPCVGRVGNFIAVGMNFADHAREINVPVPREPVLFSKAPSCVSGPYDDIVIPWGATKTDWEVELAVVIGDACLRVPEEKALRHVAGFCICNDVSEREFQLERGGTWFKGKSCPTFGPLGPWLVTPDELADIGGLGMWLEVNGERMQTGSTATMIFSIPYLVAYISHFMRLEPGDVIITGTPPGVGMGRRPQRFLGPGDVVELGIDGLGRQRQRVVASPGAAR